MNKKLVLFLGMFIILSIGFVYAGNVVNLRGGIENLKLESNGAVPVNIQDQTTQVIDLHLHDNQANLTLIQNTTLDSNTIIIANEATLANGQIICFKENKRYSQMEIISFSADTPVAGQTTITLDSPMDYAYTSLADIHNGNIALNVDGSSNNQIFHITPPEGVEWDIVRVIVVIEDNNVMDSSKFGGINKLTNGILFRKKDGVYYNIFNVKTNADFAAHTYDIAYDDKAPAGFYGFRARRTFGGQSKNGVVIRINGDTNDEFQAIVQDDLTGLTGFQMIVQGHVATD